MIILSKYLTRERPFCDEKFWYLSNCIRLKEIIGEGVKNFVCIKEPNSNKAAMYYDLNELAEKFKILAGMIATQKDFMEKVESRFNKYWPKIKPYIDEGKKIQNVEELKEYVHDLIELWTAQIIYWVVPQIPQIPEEIKKAAEDKREIFQHMSDLRSLVIVNFVKEKFPEYSEIANLMLPEEMFILGDRKLTDEEINKIKKRNNGAVLMNGGEVPIENLDEELAKRGFKIAEEDVSEIDELKGQIACKGQAKGKVKLILYKKQINELQEGEVLVTEMTTPDHVPAMKKASAIITDEGGITCHAAIVSRELGIPCIIGTKVATKLLKDGMQIEVDANNGVVKIIK